jgi:DNA repair protein RadC
MMKKNGNLTLKELPLSERPYERIEVHGAQSLSDAELIAVIIKSGTKEQSAVGLAQKVLTAAEGSGGLNNIRDLSIQQLGEINGIGRVKAIQLKALAELAKRMASTRINGERVRIRSSMDVKDLLMAELRELKKEVFKVIFLNIKNYVIKVMDISVGSLSSSIVHPREVYTEAIKCSSAGIILAHNHPSGDPTPSKEDIETTSRLYRSGEMVGISVIDHVIIGDGVFVSMKEKGLLM